MAAPAVRVASCRRLRSRSAERAAQQPCRSSCRFEFLDRVTTCGVMLPAPARGLAIFRVARDDFDQAPKALEAFGRLVAQVHEHGMMRGLLRLFDEPDRRALQARG